MKLNQKSLSRTLCMRGSCRVLSGLVLIVVFHLSTSDVSAQTVVRSWVNPSVCNTSLGAVSSPTTPFPTIAAAISATRAAVLTLQSSGTNAVGLVTAGPGIYSPNSNGEPLPVVMRDDVHLQGVDAGRVIIRGTGSPSPGLLPFQPTLPTGSRTPAEVLVDFTSLTDNSREEMIDGFTFQGGDIQVYVETEHMDKRGRVSNCLFDMRQGGIEGISGPSFGLLMVHTYGVGAGPGVEPNQGFGYYGSDPDPDPVPNTNYGPGYNDIRMNVLNNTVMMGAFGGSLSATLTISRLSAVGMCDVNEPIPSPIFWPNALSDPDTTLRGVGSPNIQNNLLRLFPGFPGTTLLGIDASDTSGNNGNGINGPTNGFDPATVGGLNSTLTFQSNIVGAPPVPVLNPDPISGGLDAAFVSEMMIFTNNSSQPGPQQAIRDFRLLPTSPFVDLGLAPGPTGILQAANGTAYVRTALSASDSYDWDGDVYGNPRIAGFAPDIGYDETNGLIMTGSMINDTRTHVTPTACTTIDATVGALSGTNTVTFITPSGGAFDLWATLAPYNGATAWNSQPGTIPTPVVISTLPLPTGSDQVYLNVAQASRFLTLNPITSANYFNPLDGTTHAFGRANYTLGTPSAPRAFANLQAVVYPANGGLLISNLQSSIY